MFVRCAVFMMFWFIVLEHFVRVCWVIRPSLLEVGSYRVQTPKPTSLFFPIFRPSFLLFLFWCGTSFHGLKQALLVQYTLPINTSNPHPKQPPSPRPILKHHIQHQNPEQTIFHPPKPPPHSQNRAEEKTTVMAVAASCTQLYG